MKAQKSLSEDFRRCLRHFAYYYANGTLNWVIGEGDILRYFDYRNDDYVSEAGSVEMIFAIYSNNIRLDLHGNVLNHTYAMRRAAQYIRQIVDEKPYQVEPPFEDWEMTLY